MPPRQVCPYCGPGAPPMKPVEIGPEGAILSFSVLEIPPMEFEPPVLLALVELEHKATVLCLGDKKYIDDVEIDMPVVVFTDDTGRIRFMPKK